MNTENQQLLCSLASNVSNSADCVKHTCPVHKGTEPTLVIHENPDTRRTYFECQDPACRFYGDAVSLVSAAKRISVSEAVNMFRPGGSLAHTLREPFLDQEAAAYTESCMAQSLLQSYMVQCQQNLRQSPGSVKIRAGLTQSNLRLLPAEAGVLVKGENIPAGFKVFNKNQYRCGTFLVYPFTYNGDITHVKVQEHENLSSLTSSVTITRNDIGVYMERFPDVVPDHLVATFDPRSATILYGNCMAETSKKPAIVAIAGFPLPASFKSVKVIHLFVPPDAPLTLADTLRAFAAPQYVDGADRQPKLRLWRSSVVAEDLVAERLRFAIGGTRNADNPSLSRWIVDEMSKMVGLGNMEPVVKALGAVSLTSERRGELIDAAVHTPNAQKIINLINNSVSATSSKLILGNGNLLQWSSSGITAINRKGDESVISTVGIQVSHRIKTHDNREILACQITTEDPRVSPLQVLIPSESCERPLALQKEILKGFIARGETPYVVIYDKTGYRWDDIMAKLAERCEIHHEVCKLGPDQTGAVHFPQAIVDLKGTSITQQKRIFTLSSSAMEAYGGILPGSPTGSRDLFKRLLERCENPYCAAFTAGLMNVVYHATNFPYSALKSWGHRAALKKFHPSHLMFVESEPGIWTPMAKQLSTFLSGSNYIPTLSFTNPVDTVKSYEALGQLPLLASIPALKSERYRRLLSDSPVSLMGVLDSGTAVRGDGNGQVTYVVPPNNIPSEVDVFEEHDLTALQDAFSGFVMEYIVSLQAIDSKSNYFQPSIPAMTAYKHACNLLGVKESSTMSAILRSYYGGYGMTGVTGLFDTLHRDLNNLDDRVLSLCQGVPEHAPGQHHIYILDNEVVITHAAIRPLNDQYNTAFGVDDLTRELKDKSMLVQEPEVRYSKGRSWVISRATWDERVVRPPVWIRERVTQGNIIQLGRIA